MDWYPLVKFLHLTAVIVFLGNTTTGLFWHAFAAHKRDPRLLAFAMEGIIKSDRWLTLPAVGFIVVSGIVQAIHLGLPLFRTAWIFWSLMMLSASGLIYMLRLLPLAHALQKTAEVGHVTGKFDLEAYRVMARRWEMWGALAVLTPFVGLALMILKPGYP